MINALMGHEFTLRKTQRPVREWGELGADLVLPCEAQLPLSPSSFSPHRLQPEAKAGAHLPSSCQLQTSALPFHPLRNRRNEHFLLQLSLESVAKIQRACQQPGDSATTVSQQEGKKADKGRAVSRTPLSSFWK